MKLPSALVAVIILLAASSAGSAQPPAAAADASPALREPFTLRLKLDGNTYYEEKFTRKIPYVADNNVYLFAGDSFGVKVAVAHGEISDISYRKDRQGADVELEFRQFVAKDGLAMMMLMIKNNLGKKLYVDAAMTNPHDSNTYKTSIRPIGPGQTSYESWAQPIIQLKLGNLRFKPQIGY